MKRAAFSILFALLVTLTATAASPTIHEGAAIFAPPTGWTRQAPAVQGGSLQFISPDRAGSLSIGSSQPLDSLDKAADVLLAEAKSLPEFRVEAKRTVGRHIGTGGQWLTFTYSYADTARPGQFDYVWVALVGAGGRRVAITAVFNDANAFNRYVPALGRMIDSLQLTTTVILEAGKPPLTRFSVDEIDDFLEWLMQTPLSDAQKATIESELRGYWRKNNRKDIDGVTKLLDARDRLAALKPERRELARQAILDSAIDEWRKDKASAAAKMMVDIYDNAHRPIAVGTPPLTRQSVDAFAEFLCFAAGEVVNARVSATAELKSKLAADLAAKYAGLPAEQQKLIAGMPLTWAALRAAWPGLSAADKQKMVDSWKKDASLVQLGNALKSEAPASSAAAPALQAHPSAASVADMQAHLQAQQMSFQVMSNVMRMQYETNRAIISNIGGGYRYEYRWR